MTLETLKLLRDCLHRVQLQVGAPDFQELAKRIAIAKQELDDAISDAES